jgi:phosphoribosylformylglycinamidine synthase
VDDPATLAWLTESGRIPARYANESGNSEGFVPYPDNPNGSLDNVAAICDGTGRVLGIMPHPERHIHPTQHPFWTRLERLPDEGDGMQFFRNAVQFFT